MKMLRREEEWARRVIQDTLDLTVGQHDDGSRSAMYDLYIERPDGPRAAVEVTAAADQESIELWNLMNGGEDRWIVPELQGGWLVTVEPRARANRLKKELPELLRTLEDAEIRRLDTERWRFDDEVRDHVARLGIASAHQGATEFPGVIYVTIEAPRERTGGLVPVTGDPLARWVGSFLAAPNQARRRAKLAASGAAERHAFVIVPGFTPAPFDVADLLLRDGAPLPTAAPHLPNEVTHVWLASTWTSGDGFRWSPDQGWTRFDKQMARRPRAAS